jgi:AGZA family xanthine/uracil permease-like MFS transporter
MMRNVVNIDFNNIKNAVPSFLTIVIMVLAYSITDGLAMEIISFVVIDLIIYIIDTIKYKKNSKLAKPKLEINFITLVVLILFLIYFLVPTVI